MNRVGVGGEQNISYTYRSRASLDIIIILCTYTNNVYYTDSIFLI